MKLQHKKKMKKSDEREMYMNDQEADWMEVRLFVIEYLMSSIRDRIQ